MALKEPTLFKLRSDFIALGAALLFAVLSVGHAIAQAVRHGQHPLAHGRYWQDIVDEVFGEADHTFAAARWAEVSALTGERDEAAVPHASQ